MSPCVRRAISVVALSSVLLPVVSLAEAGQGWYLMLPLPSSVRHEPVAKWTVEETFTNLDECKVKKTESLEGWRRSLHEERRERLLHPLQQDEHAPLFSEYMVRAWAEAQCVATDDPRLGAR